MFQSKISIIPCRKEPADQSEMVTQLLYGEFFEVISESGNWIQIKIDHDGYICYIDKKQFTEATEVIHKSKDFTVAQEPLQKYQEANQTWWLPSGSLIPNKTKKDFKRKSLREYALQYINAPYLWGGRTIFGIDCSGYTQLIFRLLGINIPRDAYQQAALGTAVSFVTEALEGDLAFFDNKEGRITHVGIILIEEDTIKIIHASGKVRVDPLDHNGIYNKDTKEYTHQLRIIKRINT